jgi:hypothetical protein
MLHPGFMLKLAGLSMAGTIAGALLAEAASHAQISGDWTVDIRTVCAVGTVVFVGAWKVSSWQKSVADRLTALEKAIERLPCLSEDGQPRCKPEERKDV